MTRLAVALVIFCLPPTARAQDLSLDDAVARAHAASPRVRIAVAEELAAEGHRAFASVPPVGNPIIGARAMFGLPDEQAATWSVFVGLPLDVSDRRGRADDEARAIEARAEADVQLARAEVRAATVAAYGRLAVAQAALDVARGRVTTVNDLASYVRRRAALQAATGLDVALADETVALAEADAIAAERELATARAAMRELLDLAPAAAPYAVDTVPATVDVTSLPALTDATVAHRAELDALDAESARSLAWGARARALAVEPWVLGLDAEQQGVSTASRSIGVSLTLTVPVVQTAQGERAVAAARVQSLASTRAVVLRTVRREVAAALAALELVRRELALHDGRVVPAAEHALELTLALFTAGSTDAFRVISAARDLQQARARRLETLADAWRARADLERAVGGVR